MYYSYICISENDKITRGVYLYTSHKTKYYVEKYHFRKNL